jgi:hypothetical protein
MGIKVAENITVLKNIEKSMNVQPKALPPLKIMLSSLKEYCDELDDDKPNMA